MGGVFRDCIVWHHDAFLMDSSGNVWRVWFGHDNQPQMELLLGNEPEWREPVTELKRRQEAHP